MTYQVTLSLPDPDMVKVLRAELLSTQRSTMEIQDQQLHISAKDATALRAALSSITRLLTVYEKAQ